MTPRRYFVGPVYRVLLGLTWLTLMVMAATLVTSVHHARQQAEATCKEAAKILVQRKPMLAHVVPAGEPCLTLARMRGE